MGGGNSHHSPSQDYSPSDYGPPPPIANDSPWSGSANLDPSVGGVGGRIGYTDGDVTGRVSGQVGPGGSGISAGVDVKWGS
jgi:hypothetical protein